MVTIAAIYSYQIYPKVYQHWRTAVQLASQMIRMSDY